MIEGLLMLPEYLLDPHKIVPNDRPLSMLIRHSNRYPITNADEVWTAGITPEGIELASDYGKWLQDNYNVGCIETSPIQRCIDTGKYLAEGINPRVSVSPVQVLSHPNEKAEYDSLADYLENKVWPARISEIAAYLVPDGHHQPGLNIYISHDSVVIAMAAYWLDKDVRGHENWPKFMEPFFLWWQGGDLTASFRGETKIVNEVLRTNLADHFSRDLFNSNNS